MVRISTAFWFTFANSTIEKILSKAVSSNTTIKDSNSFVAIFKSRNQFIINFRKMDLLQGKARQGKARQGKARQGKARQCQLTAE
ncbi:hypothetical protein [Undibacterium sp.]|uniref:hypothetical protein n=1 Tax=Undibacterium sp. TaxID=1914977 RepID=UPI00374D03C7